jgi:hypothetical protein
VENRFTPAGRAAVRLAPGPIRYPFGFGGTTPVSLERRWWVVDFPMVLRDHKSVSFAGDAGRKLLKPCPGSTVCG